jgi:MFS family permease
LAAGRRWRDKHNHGPMTAPAATSPPRYRATVAALALGQIVCWAVLFYAFTAFVLPMQRELGWSAPLLMGAYTTGLAVSAALSFAVGAAIDRGQGRAVLSWGPVVGAAGLLLWAMASHVAVLYAAWTVIGVAMAMTLYEPAFTVVTRLYPQRFREAVTAITLLGGLASTLCYPLVALLQSMLPWRWALAALALLLAARCMRACCAGHRWRRPCTRTRSTPSRRPTPPWPTRSAVAPSGP